MVAALHIITTDERLAEQRGIKGVLTGISGAFDRLLWNPPVRAKPICDGRVLGTGRVISKDAEARQWR